jgi:uncharacterized protein YfiM (DUF2279 family)
MNPLALAMAGLLFGSGLAGLDSPAARPATVVAESRPVAQALASVAPVMRDPWLGQDKAQHLFMSFALTTMTFGVARATGMRSRTALPVSAGVTLAAGIAKEMDDRRQGRFFSARDLVFDLLGIGLGLTLASYTH